MTDVERLEEIAEAHHKCRDDHKGPYVPHCAECGGNWPCGTALLEVELERLRGVVRVAREIALCIECEDEAVTHHPALLASLAALEGKP